MKSKHLFASLLVALAITPTLISCSSTLYTCWGKTYTYQGDYQSLWTKN